MSQKSNALTKIKNIAKILEKMLVDGVGSYECNYIYLPWK
jgi:hypothetical protein